MTDNTAHGCRPGAGEGGLVRQGLGRIDAEFSVGVLGILLKEPALCVLVNESIARPHKNEGDPAKYELAGSRYVVA